ncbi:MAG: GNAT family N-acetyltransferase [Sphingobacteriales bacterium 50-39]|nr:GNAT family N-acetyltransferase [Sphingobacteriales bacterium]OJW52845.1 MAG: GNAT family N-acetyltransferase [Sphingobacteriales bacterium 50-39]
MIRANHEDKNTVVDILSKSFDDNKSVNYVIKQDRSRHRRISRLMEYSFDYCTLFGEVFLSEDKNACALAVLPDRKRTSLKSILLDAKLAISCIGIGNLKKALGREEKIATIHPDSRMYYLWFIGVRPEAQGKGIGSSLLAELVAKSESMGRPLYLETSTLRNLPWYKKFGFVVHHELDFGYKLFCLKRES